MSHHIIDCHTHVGASPKNYLNQSYPYAMCVEDLVIRMDLLGIAQSVCFPFDSSYYPLDEGGEQVSAECVSRFPYQVENANLFNEIYEVFPQYAERILPFAMFDPSRETERQVELLEELHEKYTLFGLKTLTTYSKAFVSDFGEDTCIQEFARKHDLPLIFHSSWDKADIWANVFDILELVKRSPDLRFCLAHSARFSRQALDQAAELDNCYVDTSAFTIHCRVAARNSPTCPTGDERFQADYGNPFAVMLKLVEAYPDTIVWGSDTPYHYFAQKHVDANGKLRQEKIFASYDDEIKALRSLPNRLSERISNTNTNRFLGLE